MGKFKHITFVGLKCKLIFTLYFNKSIDKVSGFLYFWEKQQQTGEYYDFKH